PRPTLFPYTTLFRSIGLHPVADGENLALNPQSDFVPGRQHPRHRIETGIAKMEPSPREIDLWIFSPVNESFLHRIDSLRHRKQRSEEHTSELQSLTN